MKRKHKMKYRYNHDVISELNLGFNLMLKNDEEHFIFLATVNILYHMWELDVFKNKGWYVQYESIEQLRRRNDS